MTARAIMFQGTGSDVGKSLVVAGICRALANRGFTVRPFKPQNMSNNAAVTANGGEIGRAQHLQARAARATPCVDMNPVLLKPQSDRTAQVIVHGRVAGTLEAGNYTSDRHRLMPLVMESFARLCGEADFVVVEGAGSPAEINLRAGDIANMGFAVEAGVPVVIIGDIDRGGVIASLVGTHALLDDRDSAQMRGFIVNKFRGEISLFDGGLKAVAARTGWPSFGVLPMLSAAARLPAEDAVALERYRSGTGAFSETGGAIRIVVPMLSRISNFDDFDPLNAEPDVNVIMTPPGRALPGDADVIMLPGSKSVIADLAFLRGQGWDIDLLAHVRRGGRVLGLCGGYQMLGRLVSDPEGIEGPAASVEGLGLLNVNTVLGPAKTLRRVAGRCTASGAKISGYEMHMGRTKGPDCSRPMIALGPQENSRHGAVSADGRVRGCYVHGLFAADGFRHGYLSAVRGRAPSGVDYNGGIDRALDEVAGQFELHLDIDGLLALAAAPGHDAHGPR